MKNCLQYRGRWLHKSSDAYRLLQEQDYKKLDKHLKEVDAKHKELTK